MHNDYSLRKLGEMRHREDIAAAKAWRLAREAGLVGPAARPHALPIHRHWLARLGAWLDSLGCVLQVRYEKIRAVPVEARCAC
jgi:hypothetical protein